MLDEKGRIFGKISIVDIFVGLLILTTLAGAYYKFVLLKNNEEVLRMDTIEYKIQVSGVRQVSADALKEQVDAFEDKTGIHIGKVVKKEVLPAMDYVTKNDGTMVKAQKPERYDMIVTIVAPGIENNNGFLVNGNKEIKVGSEMAVKTRLNILQSKIISVQKVEKK